MAGIEGRKFFSAVADYRNAVGLEIFQRERKVEDRFCAGADDHDRCGGQFLQIRRNIKGLLSAAVHAADAARGEYLYARHVSYDHGRGDRGRSVLTTSAEGRQVAAAGFGDGGAFLSEIFDLFRGETGLQASADDRYRRRDCAVFAYDLFDVESSLNVLRVRHSVRDDRGFKRHDRLAGGDGGRHLGINVEIFIC